MSKPAASPGGRDPSPQRLAYRPAELASLVGLSCKAIYRAIERGELRAARVANGSRLLIPVGEAEAWLAESLVAAAERAVVATPHRRRVGRPRPLANAIADLDLRPEPGYDREAS